MAFWELHQPLHAVALIDHNGRPHTYAALSAATDDVASRLRRYPVRDVGFILFEAHVDSIATYLGALRSGVRVPLLLQPSMNGLVPEDPGRHLPPRVDRRRDKRADRRPVLPGP